MNRRSLHLVRRWRQLDRASRRTLAEATVALGMASAAVALLPFRRAIRLGSQPLGRKGVDVQVIEHVRWAVEAAARRVPWRAVCIEQGLALQWMLRRRGVDAQLHYGVGRGPGDQLQAHVWVEADDDIVIGAEEAPRFRRVGTFPGVESL